MIDAKFQEKLICCFKNDNNLVNFDPSTQKSQNLHFHWFLLCKVFNVRPKKVQRSYFFMTLKSDVKFEEKLTCGLENDMSYMAHFHQSTWKSQKCFL